MDTRLTVLGSGSSGNCYLVQNSNECLIIEAGINPNYTLRAIDFDLSIISGCIATHSHLDHSKYALQYAQKGIKVYSHEDTFRGFKHHNFIIIDDKKTFKVGNFRIKAFELVHDVKTYGFYINHPETGNFCFITDTSEIPYKFKGMNHILVESNFDEELINTNDTSYFLRDRIVSSHLSFDKCNEFVMNSDLSQVVNIVLLHASDFNSDVGAFKAKMKQNTNKQVYIADKGLEINFNINPF